MPKVKFTRNSLAREIDPEIDQPFKAGETYDLPEESCNRWEKRQAAQRVEEAAPAKAPAAKAKADAKQDK